MRQKFFVILLGAVCFAFSQVQAQFVETVPDLPVFQPTYTWGDFLMGKSCLADFNTLQQLPFLSSEQKNLQSKMQSYCLDKVTVWDSLLTVFRQNKKALLIDRTLKKNTSFFGYIKVLPYYFFDIHNMRPINADLPSKLDKIQNAIEAKNPEQVISLIQDLSPNEQVFFVSLFNEATGLIDFEKALSKEEVLY